MKDTYIRIRLSERDKQELLKQAEEKQMNMSEYLLYLIRKNEMENKKMFRYEVYEDNGGGIVLFVFEKNEIVYIHYDYEYHPDDLLSDIEHIENVSDFDGNFIEKLEEMNKTAYEFYEEYTTGNGVELIDNNGNVYFERMNCSGNKCYKSYKKGEKEND